MPVDVTQVVVGNATMFTAPSGTSYPADTHPTNQGVGGTFSDWTTPANWVNVGATQEGITFGLVQNTNDITIEEQSPPAKITVNSTEISVATVLSEDVLETLKLVYGGGTITTTAAATGVPGKKQLVLAEGLTELALGFDAPNKYGFYRRIKVPRVLSVANVQTAYRRAADARRYSVTFRAICPPNQITVTDITAAALP